MILRSHVLGNESIDIVGISGALVVAETAVKRFAFVLFYYFSLAQFNITVPYVARAEIAFGVLVGYTSKYHTSVKVTTLSAT
jgi:hypothetical protein